MPLKWIRFFFEEANFIKSFEDVKILCTQKFPFLLARTVYNPFINARVPASLQVEPTNICNLNCICCSADRMKRKKGYMDFELFKKVIDEGASIGVKRIHLFNHGEPMLHPQIMDMIHYIKTKGLGISMHTNGMLLTEEKSRDLLNSGVNSGDYLIFSVLAYSKELHEKIMKGIDHDTVVNNIQSFLALRKQLNINGPIVEVIFYPMAENYREKEQFVRYWRRIVDHVHPIKDISQSFARYKTNDKSIPMRKEPCPNLWERMQVHWNGDVSMCTQDFDGDYIFGNLREQSIRDIWNGDKRLSIKKLHEEKKYQDIELCSRCDE